MEYAVYATMTVKFLAQVLVLYLEMEQQREDTQIWVDSLKGVIICSGMPTDTF